VKLASTLVEGAEGSSERSRRRRRRREGGEEEKESSSVEDNDGDLETERTGAGEACNGAEYGPLIGGRVAHFRTLANHSPYLGQEGWVSLTTPARCSVVFDAFPCSSTAPCRHRLDRSAEFAFRDEFCFSFFEPLRAVFRSLGCEPCQ